MKPSEILRKAAQRLEAGCFDYEIGACWAICEVTCGAVDGYDHNAEPMKTMKRLYNKSRNTYWWGADQDSRIIGLCLAAAIAESEGQ